MLSSFFVRFSFLLILIFPHLLLGVEDSPWNHPKHLTILGSPFIDVVLDVDPTFIQKCCLEIGGIHPVESSKIKDIFLLYKETFPETHIVTQRKEPLNLSQEQLSGLGFVCRRNDEIPFDGNDFFSNGPVLQQLDQIRLILHSSPYKDTLVYSFQRAKTFFQKKWFFEILSLEGYTLIDSQLMLYEDCIEKVLKEAKNRRNKILMDLGDLKIITTFQSRIWSFLDQVDVLFLSEDSGKALVEIPDITRAVDVLAHVVPTLFVYSHDSIQIIQKKQKILHRCNRESLSQLIPGFLFGYMNQGSLEYCFRCVQSLSEEV
ncbi:hypothetical protein [Chlamydia sp. 17-3921]|uniref:hypothetical protein n=1 Tax=Chlamydia sp. 17-3921 TaxID=2675798 RepID=UPI001917CF75|nr:hypothetical protein [Chlamydia sp. 17-3921]